MLLKAFVQDEGEMPFFPFVVLVIPEILESDEILIANGKFKAETLYFGVRWAVI